MEKFIPYEKLSKKKKRELNLKRRGSWNGLNPVTRKPANPKAYNRKKVQNRFKDYDNALSFLFYKRFKCMDLSKLFCIFLTIP